jgi:hypothetical protein
MSITTDNRSEQALATVEHIDPQTLEFEDNVRDEVELDKDAFRSRSMCARGVTGAPSMPRRSLSTATRLPQYEWPAGPQAGTPPGGSTG